MKNSSFRGARQREPGIQKLSIEIPGSRDARPGMTKKGNHYEFR